MQNLNSQSFLLGLAAGTFGTLASLKLSGEITFPWILIASPFWFFLPLVSSILRSLRRTVK